MALRVRVVPCILSGDRVEIIDRLVTLSSRAAQRDGLDCGIATQSVICQRHVLGERADGLRNEVDAEVAGCAERERGSGTAILRRACAGHLFEVGGGETDTGDIQRSVSDILHRKGLRTVAAGQAYLSLREAERRRLRADGLDNIWRVAVVGDEKISGSIDGDAVGTLPAAAYGDRRSAARRDFNDSSAAGRDIYIPGSVHSDGFRAAYACRQHNWRAAAGRRLEHAPAARW